MLWHTAKQTLSFLGNLSHIFMVSVTSLQAWRLKNRTANLLAGSVFPESIPSLLSHFKCGHFCCYILYTQ